MPNEELQQQSQSNNEAVKSLICSPEQSTSGDKTEQQLFSSAVEKKGANLGVDVKLAEAHTRVYDAFSRAFSRQNTQFEKAIRSLDSLNDQIVEFFLTSSEEKNEDDEFSKQRHFIGPSLGLMKKLLLDAQTKFRKMVEENEQLARRIDGDLQTAHEEVDVLRRDLADTNRRIAEMQANSPPQGEENGTPSKSNNDKNLFDKRQQPLINGTEEYDVSPKNNFQNQISFLREENERLQEKNSLLLKEVDELRYLKEAILKSEIQPTDGEEKGVDLKEKKLDPNVSHLALELTHAKEALSALKADRKRLKAEKFDLLNQMKQLYATLEDKERELREFIRTYEQRMKDSDESLRQMANERDESEREKWNILKHARDEAERAVALATQLGKKDVAVKRLEEELEAVRRQMSALGYSSDADSVRTNGPSLHPVFTPTCSPLPVSTPTPSVSTPTCSPLPLSNCTSTTNGRGSSADSGVRLSSDRESTASQEASSLTTAVERHPNGDSDGASICSSTATGASSSHYYYYYYGCDPGTPNKDGSSTIYANPSLLRDESRSSLNRKGDRTPSDSRNDTTNSSCTTPVNGTDDVPFGHVNQQSGANNSGGTLSRSAEELCERLAEAGDTPSKSKGVSMTLTRKNHKGGGTWGSISRVFARQKKRAPFDSSSFEGDCNDPNPGEKVSSQSNPNLTKPT